MIDQGPLKTTPLLRSKWLIHAFMISITLNIALVATFSYFVLREKKEPLSSQEIRLQPNRPLKSLSTSYASVLKGYFLSSFSELLVALEDETHIEEGQRACDLALACLVTFHHFDLQRALAGFSIEKREFFFQNGEQEIPLTLYSGLNEDRLDALRTFARVEVWPLTPEGLFEKLKSQKKESPQDLIDTFCRTSEFDRIKRAFCLEFPSISQDTLLHLLLKTKWSRVAALSAQIHNHPQGKIEDLGAVLTLSLEEKSTEGAHLLTHLGEEFALKQLTDDQLELLLDLLEHKSPEVEYFLRAFGKSLRADWLKDQAEKKLTEQTKTEKTWTGKIKTGKIKTGKTRQEDPPELTYVIKWGDTLWKISRDLGVSIAEIKGCNQLTSDVLTPGKSLRIPKKKRGH